MLDFYLNMLMFIQATFWMFIYLRTLIEDKRDLRTRYQVTPKPNPHPYPPNLLSLLPSPNDPQPQLYHPYLNPYYYPYP